MIAYLSGAMENAKNEGSEWRNEMTIWLKEKLNHSVIDPFYPHLLKFQYMLR